MKGSWQGKLGHVEKVHVSHAEGCDVHPGQGDKVHRRLFASGCLQPIGHQQSF